MVEFQSVIVAGGRGTRLGGIDKGALRDADGSLVNRALRASADARAVALVGRGHALGRILRVDERPRFGGPVAAIAAGLDALRDAAAWTLVLAGDMPHVEQAVPPLLAAVTGDGVLAVDGAGRRQPLLAVYRTSVLHGALRRLGDVSGASMRELVHPLVLSTVTLGDRLCADVDTRADVLRHGLHEPSGRARVA